MKAFSVCAAVAAAVALGAGAASLELDRMAASYHSYEFADEAWTPPPEGYPPFNTPYFIIAWFVYSEHVGVNLQTGGVSAEIF